MPAVDRKLFSGWAYITRAEKVPGCWVAHCLDFDIVTQGDSPQHALDMLHEAVAICLADDLNRGFDPHDRRAADEDWAPLLRLFDRHTKVQVNQMDSTEYSEFAVHMTVELVRVRPAELEPAGRRLDIASDSAVAA